MRFIYLDANLSLTHTHRHTYKHAQRQSTCRAQCALKVNLQMITIKIRKYLSPSFERNKNRTNNN